jgi:hypothetical protein
LVEVQRRLLIACILAAASPACAEKFYPDDPLTAMPKPLPVAHARNRKINELYDFLTNSTTAPRQKPIRALGINTLGEVLDSDWYTNRTGLTIEELQRGPDRGHAPAPGPLTITAVKTEGVTPGFWIKDSRDRKFLVKVDPPENPEMATAADVVGSKFFYAFGYNVPENYILHFRRDQLQVAPDAIITDEDNRKRHLRLEDIDKILKPVRRETDGGFRGMASYFIEGEILGPFRFAGTRSDDPNDVYPHEQRRDLRGLIVFAAWLQHTDAKSGNTLDSLVELDGVKRIKHYLIDFGAIMGSDSTGPKDPRAGHEYFIAYKPGLLRLATLGFYVPQWERLSFPSQPAVGNFTAEDFQPDDWKSNYPNPAFLNCLPDDEFWAAKKVMAFKPEEIRAMVETGEYNSAEATAYLTRTLIDRQRKIGETFFAKVLPFDGFRIQNGRLRFDDLAVVYGLGQPRNYSVQWSRFDNHTGNSKPIPGETRFEIPVNQSDGYLSAEISVPGEPKCVTVYVRKHESQILVVGVDRTW